MESISIKSYLEKIKKENKFLTKEEIKNFVLKRFELGVIFKETHIKIHRIEYTNNYGHVNRYYFICPNCENHAVRLYYVNAKLHCCRCYNVSPSNIDNDRDRIAVIQRDLYYLFNKKDFITTNYAKSIVARIEKYFNQLPNIYKIAYNRIVFTEMKNWCVSMMKDETKSPDYREAMRDIFNILNNIKKVLIKTKLMDAPTVV